MSRKLCALSCIAGLFLILCIGGCGGQSPLPAADTGQEIDPASPEARAADAAALKAAPEWQLPLMPAFEQAAAAYEVPLDLLLTLGKIGSGLENRGKEPTIEGGYGVMALRNSEMSQSLEEAAQLTGVTTDQLIDNPVANINGAAAVLSAYAIEAGVDRAQGIEAWLPAVIKYAGLDEESSKFFARGVYEIIELGWSLTNGFGEEFAVASQPLQTIDLQSLIPPGLKQISIEDLEAGVDPDTIGVPADKDDRLNVDYPGATWNPAASCNYTATSSSKDTIIVHTIQGSAAGTLSWFKNCAAQVSSQYVVSEAGGVWQCVVESYKAWHVGCLNTRSIGIEHEGYAESSSHPVALYNASAALCKNICDRRGIVKAHRTCAPGILGHNDANNCHCGGTHWDPGGGWDWGYFINRIVGTPPPPTWAATYKAQSYPSTMVAGSTAIVWAEFNNTGTGHWKHDETRLGTSSPQDRSSPFCNVPNWIGCNRPSDVDQSDVANGQVGRFTFILKAPANAGTYTEKFKPVREGVTWFGPEITWTINVTPSGPDVTPPSTPGTPTATAASTSQINLSWTAASDNVGVTEYRIYRNGAYLDSVGGSTLTYSNTGLAMGTTYTYRISAKDAAGNESAQSGQRDETTWLILDNASAGFTASASWATSAASSDKYGADYRWRSTSAISDQAVWAFNIPTADSYQVYVWWAQGSNRSTAAPYSVNGSAGIPKNQQTGGGQWNSIGTFSMAAGSNNVKLSCWASAGYVVVADAIRVIRR